MEFYKRTEKDKELIKKFEQLRLTGTGKEMIAFMEGLEQDQLLMIADYCGEQMCKGR